MRKEKEMTDSIFRGLEEQVERRLTLVTCGQATTETLVNLQLALLAKKLDLVCDKLDQVLGVLDSLDAKKP